jgi:hypothetical protein
MSIRELARNSRCLCGSGKKYKQCCLNKRQMAMDGQSVFRGIGKNSSQDVADALVAAQNFPCILCASDLIARTSLFIPTGDMAKKLGQPDGKIRHFFYSVCCECEKLPDLLEKIENNILEDYKKSIN